MSITLRVERLEESLQRPAIHVVNVYEGETIAEAFAIEKPSLVRGPRDIVVGLTKYGETRNDELMATDD